MEKEEKEYTEVFKKAQQLGYVEKDPNLDVGGIDTAHKISLLTACAFGTRIDFENVVIKGDSKCVNNRHQKCWIHGI